MNQVMTVADTELLDTVRDDVNQLLAGYFEKKIQTAGEMSPQYSRLWQVMSDLSRAGGKRLRPYMVVLGYRSFGGADYQAVLPVAAAWELLHLCMLIHDDIIDNDLVRYGVPNVAGSYRSIYAPFVSDEARRGHLATSAALMAGDLALSSAYELIMDAGLEDSDKLLAARYLAAATFNVAGGELMDTESVLYPVMEVDALQVARFKTASYSFVGPLSAGAALAGASETSLVLLRQYGDAVGCAFQLADDMLGTFGDETVTGKSSRGDLSEGKRTYMLQQAFQLSRGDQLQQLQDLVGNADLTAAEADKLRGIITDCGARDKTERAIAEFAEQAHAIVAELDIAAECKQDMKALIAAATVRKY